MSHGSEGDGDNYWPGYVDALTSMVQVLAFVMMMLAMAVFVLSQSVSKNAVEAIAKAVDAKVKPNADVKQLTQAVLEKLEGLRGSAPGAVAEKPPEPTTPAAPPSAPSDAKVSDMRYVGPKAQPDRGNVEVVADAPTLSIGFEERSFRIEPDRGAAIGKFVDEQGVVGKGQTIVVNAYAYSEEGAVSEARRLAYYRGMVVRKQLIDAKVRADDIRITVNDTSDKGKGSTVELLIAKRVGH